MGMPVLLAAFGWAPWILAMFVFFYPFAFRKPKKFRHRDRKQTKSG